MEKVRERKVSAGVGSFAASHSVHALSDSRMASTSARARARGTPSLPSDVSWRAIASAGREIPMGEATPERNTFAERSAGSAGGVKFASAHGIPGAAESLRPSPDSLAQARDSVSIAKCAQVGELAKWNAQFSRKGWESERMFDASVEAYSARVCA